ncbi:phage holin family protein [Nocardioides sp. JQ2195]|uniref:phage holin family protein n=1 Tax=Nocardioides sp. JQ2195 TaxID=2592334 RepID=UPI00143E9592|nr:phage holin family protein [Nocardioides sp. JQ2195]QIX27261.1 phage holin family protein [Nocardioides sp. JQ2195]
MTDPVLTDAPNRPTAPVATAASTPSTADLLRQMSDDTRRLIKDEIGLAQLEMKDKAKHVGVGAGLFGTAGILGLFGFGALVATAIIALALVMDAWLAALIVTVVLFVAAAVAGLVGKKQVTEGTPPKPEQALANVKKDVNTLKGAGND